MMSPMLMYDMAYDMAYALVYGMQKDAMMIISDMGFDMV